MLKRNDNKACLLVSRVCPARTHLTMPGEKQDSESSQPRTLGVPLENPGFPPTNSLQTDFLISGLSCISASLTVSTCRGSQHASYPGGAEINTPCVGCCKRSNGLRSLEPPFMHNFIRNTKLIQFQSESCEVDVSSQGSTIACRLYRASCSVQYTLPL